MKRLLLIGLTGLLFACAQDLGGVRGDPTRTARGASASLATVSPVVRAMAAEATRQEPPSAEPAPAEPQSGEPRSGEPQTVTAPPDRAGVPSASAAAGEGSRPGAGPARAAVLPRTITVGPTGQVKTIAEAAKLARDGDTVEVQAGEYRGDVALWTQKRLTIRAVGGRAALIADGRAVEGKGIWVIRNGDFEIDGFDFIGARVSAKNGAGIRFEHGNLVVRNSRFIANENGILTSNDGVSTLRIERSLFERNGHGDGYSHGVYAGRIARVEVRESWFRDGRVGQLLKTRARENIIERNRIVDERGDSSYELEFPNGGLARVVGNIIAQSPRTSNRVIVSFGVEGYKWPQNELIMQHNTVIDLRGQSGVFVRVSPGDATATLTDNLWVGKGGFELKAETKQSGNQRAISAVLLDPAAGDYRMNRPDLAALAAEPPELPPAWVARYVLPEPTTAVDADRSGSSQPGVAGTGVARAAGAVTARTGAAAATPQSRTAAASSGAASKPAPPPRTWRVGPDGDVPTIAAAARQARDGDTVEIPAGEYQGEVALWRQKRLTIRSVGGRAVLRADGKLAEGKAIWVLRNGAFEIDGFDFVGARSSSGNAAGIRFEHGRLIVRNSRFLDNETGVMTGNDQQAQLTIEHCEISGPREGSRPYHNLRVGRIGHFELRNSTVRRGRTGNLVQSRAMNSVVVDNQLVDGSDGRASYELDFPDGGIVTADGNRIEQGPHTENLTIVSFGSERYHWPRNELHMAKNTLVNQAARDAVFVRVAPGDADVALRGNTWVGPGRLLVPASVDLSSNQAIGS